MRYKPCFALNFISKFIPFHYRFIGICDQEMKNNKSMFDGASAALRYGELPIRITTRKQSEQKQNPMLILCNDEDVRYFTREKHLTFKNGMDSFFHCVFNAV